MAEGPSTEVFNKTVDEDLSRHIWERGPYFKMSARKGQLLVPREGTQNSLL